MAATNIAARLDSRFLLAFQPFAPPTVEEELVDVGIADLNAYSETTSTLIVTYGGIEARILLHGLTPLFDREPRQDICRRGMHQLIEALSEWEKSGSAITWHALDWGK